MVYRGSGKKTIFFPSGARTSFLCKMFKKIGAHLREEIFNFPEHPKTFESVENSQNYNQIKIINTHVFFLRKKTRSSIDRVNSFKY